MGQSDSLVGGVEEQGGGQGSDSSVDYVATDTEHAASEDNIHDIIVPLITELSTHLQNHGLRTLKYWISVMEIYGRHHKEIAAVTMRSNEHQPQDVTIHLAVDNTNTIDHDHDHGAIATKSNIDDKWLLPHSTADVKRVLAEVVQLEASLTYLLCNQVQPLLA